MKHKNMINAVDEIITTAKNNEIIHLYTEKTNANTAIMKINNKELVNFGSCSYLGLEFNKNLIKGSSNAIANFGTQFSASRAYVSCGLYETLEQKFEKIFKSKNIVVTPTTTLGHIATIPTIISDNDAIVIDHQVHSSVQTAVGLLKARKINIEMIRHNRMDMLEEKIIALKNKHEKVWYMADGIYSMYGDKAPINELKRLMDKYDNFYCYIDDAHGMSCYGENGEGYVMSEGRHKKMVVAVSLAKGFATGGAVIVFPNFKMASLVRNCGGPMITSGPIQPAVLGAAIESAKIHLSDDFSKYQKELKNKINYTNKKLLEHKLPLVHYNDTPIFFIGVGLPSVGNNLLKKMKNEGFYQNLGIFPAVPMKNTGVRFTITRLNTYKQIDNMVKELAKNFNLAMSEENYTMEKLSKAFKIDFNNRNIDNSINNLILQSKLKVTLYKSINEIDPAEWNSLHENEGTFNHSGLQLLERTFNDKINIEDNWKFDYITIKDLNNNIVLSTFCTTSLSKDDMFSSAETSEIVEEIRRKNKYHLTSKVLTLGSLFTEGNHLYIDYNSRLWKEACSLLMDNLTSLQEKYKANTIMLRDFNSVPRELSKLFSENGFLKIETFEDNFVANPYASIEELMTRLPKKKRKFVRDKVLPFHQNFSSNINKTPNLVEIEKWYELYSNVYNKKKEINTFKLPFKLFKEIAIDPNWEVIELQRKINNETVAVMLCHISKNHTSTMLVGLNYKFQDEKIYQQLLINCVIRANKLNKKKVLMGVTASFEKKKLGAEQKSLCAFVQSEDHFNADVVMNAPEQILGNELVLSA